MADRAGVCDFLSWKDKSRERLASPFRIPAGRVALVAHAPCGFNCRLSLGQRNETRHFFLARCL